MGLVLSLLAGCASGGTKVDKALLADRTPSPYSVALETHYQVHCPDVVEFQIAGKRPWSGRREVSADGRVVVDPLGPTRVDGLTTPEIAAHLATRLGIQPELVSVMVVEHKSQHVYIYGEVAGLQRAVEYRGPETVVELLQRAGGLTSGAAPGDVQVVRTHVADGKQPEVFEVDLRAVVLKKQQQTNIHLQPFDQVYIGQTRQCFLSKCMPPWLRPFFESLCGMEKQQLFEAPQPSLAKAGP